MNQSSPFKRLRFSIYFLLGAILGPIIFEPQLKQLTFPEPPSWFLLTLAGAFGGLAYAVRNNELQLPHKSENKFNPGVLADCLTGVAGAYVIILIMPGDFPAPPPNKQPVDLIIEILATGIIGGYGGRGILDRALDDILRQQKTLKNKQDELEDKVKGNSNRIKENLGRIEQVKEQAYSGAKALALLERYFDEDLEPTNENEDIKELIEKASPRERAIIFVEAKRVRERNMWKKPYMVERTTPVFEALVVVGTDDQFLHRYHAQLGYSLESSREPEWSRAKDELSKAIEIRDKLPDKDEGGFWVYEFNRAICRIKLDENFKKDKPALSVVRDPILDDLGTATQSRNHTVAQFNEYLDKLDKRLKKEICKWLKLNNTSPEDIGFPKEFDSMSEPNSSNKSHVAGAVA